MCVGEPTLQPDVVGRALEQTENIHVSLGSAASWPVMGPETDLPAAKFSTRAVLWLR